MLALDLRRDELLRAAGLHTVPAVIPAPGRAFTGRGALQELRQLVSGLRSALCVPGSGQWAEGVYVRREEGGWLLGRAKLVNPAFRQALQGPSVAAGPAGAAASGSSAGGTHWTKRATEWNRVRPDLWLAEPASDPWDADAAVPTAPAAAASVKLCGGGAYLALVGPAVDAAASLALAPRSGEADAVPAGHVAHRVARDGPHHHVTLVTPPEMEELTSGYGMDPKDAYDRVVSEIGPSGGAWLPLGLGRAACPASGSEALFLLVAWPAGHAARAALGLQRRQHFHVTLGFSRTDVHDRPKGLTALVGGRLDERWLQRCAAALGPEPSDAAALLVLQALGELDPQHQDHAGAGSAAQPPCLTPGLIETVRSLLGAALEWTADAEADGVEGGGHGAQGSAAGCGWRRFVAGCAHVAMARLAGRCGDLEAVVEHATAAEALAAAGAAGACASPLPPTAARVLAAAGACLVGKAHSQADALAAAAGAFERAAVALREAGMPDGASLLSSQPPSLLLRAVRPAMGEEEMRGAAAACARKLARLQQQQQQHHQQEKERKQQGATTKDGCRSQGEQAGGPGLPGTMAARGIAQGNRTGSSDGDNDGGGGGSGNGSGGAAALPGAAGASSAPLDPRHRAVVRGVVMVPCDAAANADGGGAAWEVADVTLPRNTSWLVPGVLMGGSTPKRPDQVNQMHHCH
ncbi:hypothetical protein GPECTOR_45g114 [Gonium pectorale]|uniref:Swiss Army Knife 2H phosphoesterase domain-containing protein n=1 Tax=Gonium pectorale TaxID=33097 RepID=A0A150G8T3_GONPE|nr:hypothetical protein GPECTOR_45g114 [Gonium pectorale]|eukprot:KXZ46244.1 hypothetical protein GPECTOR_45g114 [Gonium pectorale]